MITNWIWINDAIWMQKRCVILACININTLSKSWKVIISFYFMLVIAKLIYCFFFWDSSNCISFREGQSEWSADDKLNFMKRDWRKCECLVWEEKRSIALFKYWKNVLWKKVKTCYLSPIAAHRIMTLNHSMCK